MRNTIPSVITFTFGLLLLAGCDPVAQEPSLVTAEGTERAAAGAESEHAHEDCGGQGNCGQGMPAEDEDPLTTPQSAGDEVDESIELVDAATILADPEAYEGQTVRIAGQVKGFCHHRRAWFAIDVPEGNPPYLRVLTAPQFQVPSGVMNTQATAVGTVEVIEVPQSRLSHYEREHQLGEGEDRQGRARRALLRATGAVFSPAES